MTIRKRLLLYILVPLISALLILSIFNYFYSSWFLEKKASLMLLSEAGAINNEIRQSIRHTESDLAMLLSNRMIKEYVMYSRLGLLDYAEDERWKIEEDFLKVAEEKPEYVSIRFVGLDGKSTIDIIDKRISYGHFHFSGEDWFVNALQLGKEESFVSPLHLCKEHDKPSISISRLYYDDVGEKGGIISLYVHTDEFFQGILGKTIGEKGYAYLIDNRGIIVAHKDAAGTGTDVKEYESSKRAIAGDTGTITEFDETNTALMKKAYIPLKIGGLYLVTSQPMKEISAFGVQLQSFNLIFFITTVLFVSIISSMVAKRISKPIKELHNGTEIIETGNMDHRIEINTGDEIEQLATSFNKMVAGLKEKNDELQKSEIKYRRLVESSPDMIHLIDTRGRFLSVNRIETETLGYTPEEFFGMEIKDIISPEHIENTKNAFIVLKEKGSVTYETELLSKDGKKIPVEVNAVANYDMDGNFTSALGILRDITERKIAEEAIHQRSKDLNILNNIIVDVTSTINLNNVLEKVTRNAVELSGADAGSVAIYDKEREVMTYPYHYNMPGELNKVIAKKGRGLAEHVMKTGNPVIMDDYPAHPRALKEFIDAGIKVLAAVPLISKGRTFGALGVFGLTPEKRFTKRQLELLEGVGRQAAIAIENARLFDKIKQFSERLEQKVKERTSELEEKTEKLEKSESALRYLLEDVNEIRADLERANKKLKELDRLKSMFIASMSHELRTPLNSIIGFTGLILQGMTGEINDEQRNQLQRVYSSAKHLLSLITDVIDISKIEAGKIEAYVEEFQLDEVIKEAISSLATQIDNKGLGLETSIPQGLRLKTDRRRLLQCILNYLSNSVKFTEKGEIIITAHESDGMVEISVKDTGIGIKEEDVPKLFNSFVRLDSPLKLKTPGNGLGLYLTKKLAVEVLGGSVSVESSFGEGSTFVLRIPKEL